MILRKILDQYVSSYQRWSKSVIRLGNNEGLKTSTKTSTFVDADANANANANADAAADAGGSTIAVRERCSGELKIVKRLYPTSIVGGQKNLWYLLNLSSENEYLEMWRADNFVKNWRNLPICNPKPDLHNVNSHTNFGKNQLVSTQFIVRRWIYKRVADR